MTEQSTKKKVKKLTPLMQQYFDLKSKYSDAILLFRVGDFYETFGEDAITAAQTLAITLTKRNNGGSDIELAGFPHHSLDVYLPRLVKAGFRVAICEQLEKPSKEKKIVKRGVTDVVTPGLSFDDSILDQKDNNFLCAISGDKHRYGISFLDISTAEFYCCEGNEEQLVKLIETFDPSEVLVAKSEKGNIQKLLGSNRYIYGIDEWVFQKDHCHEQLINHFGVISLKGFGIDNMEEAIISSGVILHYLDQTENKQLKHISSIQRIQKDEFVWLDNFTIRNLEIFRSHHISGKSLLESIDHTISPMGGRCLKKWFMMPLLDVQQINNRLEAVQYFYGEEDLIDEIQLYLRQTGDLERTAAKISTQRINPRQVSGLIDSCEAFQQIKDLMSHSSNDSVKQLADQINPCQVLLEKLKNTLNESPPVNIAKGHVIKAGFNDDLDELRSLIDDSKSFLLKIQQEEIQNTGIQNLKIGFNNVFGYYLEVTNKYKNQGLIPEHWVRKQTLTNSERYITDELKTLETKILNAESQILELEQKLFQELVSFMLGHIESLQLNANLLAHTDCLLSFAKMAIKNNYVKPEVNNSLELDIKDGRHPVIELQMPKGEAFIPNDVYLNNSDQQIIMITGPNMSGKSAVLRQTALICLMAQCGSFVPASSATIGIIDKLFTRVGASDNISSGESTFMVEMNETANIMNNISNRSLILLDEIGRGTSTYDGISIAWSIAEYLHESEARPKTLFATHYHELNDLANRFDRIKNYNVSTAETEEGMVFLRKLKPGGSAHSFGIQVAKLAGMPNEIIIRANMILDDLEDKMQRAGGDNADKIKNNYQYQLSIFEQDSAESKALLMDICNIDVNSLTPVEAMLKLLDIQKMIKEGMD